MDRMKILMIICDGMGDRPYKDLRWKTPLQVARTPNIDTLAKMGQSGLMDTIDVGIVPGSDTAHLALLGYDPVKNYTGRGPFEAAGVGMELEGGDIAFRCNFSTVDDTMMVKDRRAGRIAEGTKELAAVLNDIKIEDVEIHFREAAEHRAVLVLRGPGLSPEVSDTDPHEIGAVVWQALAKTPEAEKTARILNDFTELSFKLLNAHQVNKKREKDGKPPANIVLCRGAGMMPHIRPFPEEHGLSGAAVVGIPLVKGLCRLVGLDVMEVEGADGTRSTNLPGKIDATIEALGTHDFVILHIKGTDVMGHDCDARGKVDFIEKIDLAIKQLMESIGDDVIIALTADHSTPLCTAEHSADPVPLVVCGGGLRIDDVKTFNEISVAQGSLGHIRGSQLLPMLLGLGGWKEKFGA